MTDVLQFEDSILTNEGDIHSFIRSARAGSPSRSPAGSRGKGRRHQAGVARPGLGHERCRRAHVAVRRSAAHRRRMVEDAGSGCRGHGHTRPSPGAPGGTLARSWELVLAQVEFGEGSAVQWPEFYRRLREAGQKVHVTERTVAIGELRW